MLVLYVIFINLLGFILMALDKSFAIKHKRRIPEKNLIIAALAGGAAGIFLGMRFCRHKTRHLKFSLGVPVIIILQLIFVAWLSIYINGINS